MTLQSIDEIKEYVLNEYRNESTELNGLFFDFDVNMTKKDIIQAYIDIQRIINDDIVIHLNNPNITQKNEDDYIWGTETECDDDYMNENYNGNMMTFLESFNDKELETGWCRIMEIENSDDDNTLIGGYKLDFVF